jgi:hypothetical protein
LPRSAARALGWLVEVNNYLKKPGALQLLQQLGEGKAARTVVFPFEAILRDADERFRGFTEHLGHVKDLEDAIGHYIDAVERLANMHDYGEADLINHWASRVEEQHKELTTELSSFWLAHSAGDDYEVRKLAADLRTAPWGDAASEREANAKGLRREALKVVEQKLDMNDMEDVHKLRRYCRWFALLARALSGAIVLEGDGPKRFDDYIAKAAKLDFASLPVADREPNALTLPQSLWSAASYIIEELGFLKAKGEVAIALTDALVATRDLKKKEAREEALRIMKVSPKERESWTRAAEKLYSEARKVFGAIIEHLEAQMKDAKR